ncbi:hypothetical protein L209DRAFT_554192 [Thermothelomyces heterothallicus CBS 203.75]
MPKPTRLRFCSEKGRGAPAARDKGVSCQLNRRRPATVSPPSCCPLTAPPAEAACLPVLATETDPDPATWAPETALPACLPATRQTSPTRSRRRPFRREDAAEVEKAGGALDSRSETQRNAINYQWEGLVFPFPCPFFDGEGGGF